MAVVSILPPACPLYGEAYKLNTKVTFKKDMLKAITSLQRSHLIKTYFLYKPRILLPFSLICMQVSTIKGNKR